MLAFPEHLEVRSVKHSPHTVGGRRGEVHGQEAKVRAPGSRPPAMLPAAYKPTGPRPLNWDHRERAVKTVS